MSSAVTKEIHGVLSALSEAGGESVTEELSRVTGLDASRLMVPLTEAESSGWVTIESEKRKELSLTDAGIEAVREGVPERRFLPVLNEAGGSMPMAQVKAATEKLGVPMGDVVKWGGRKSWVAMEKGTMTITETGRQALEEPAADEILLERVRSSEKLFVDELREQWSDPEEAVALLESRKDLVKARDRVRRTVRITDAGKALLEKGVEVLDERNVLTSEEILSGEWKKIKLRPFDVTLPAESRYPVKTHPFQKILQETREAFLEMGFTEIVSPMVETAFWNFDALFQPQDHPARDMQDTFYMSSPEKADLPEDREVVSRVKDAHENGGDTGSLGWGYRWSDEEARRLVLRTHTTSATIRAVASHKGGPGKYFCVGRVFRNETITYKHLPEFMQIDGIVIDDEASFAMLLSILKEFYRKMGFEKVRFKPAFFPYTEPSAEVFVWAESRKSWLELGGSGVFRPEVTRPLGCDLPVLAWGLGLERLAMMRYGLQDIRTLYWADLDWIREVPRCR